MATRNVDKISELCYIIDMKANLTHKILSYDPNEFMPIYRDGRADNTSEFVKYKLKKAFMPTLMKINDSFENH